MDLTNGAVRDRRNSESDPSEVLSLFPNDHAPWVVMQRNRETSGRSIPKQVKRAKMEKKHYVFDLQQHCNPINDDHVYGLTRSLFGYFAPSVAYCLKELQLTRGVVHLAAKKQLKLPVRIGTGKALNPLASLETLHVEICSKECFPFIKTISKATQNVSTLIIEYAKNPCSGCVPHQMNEFWDMMHWDPVMLKRLALVGFAPDVDMVMGSDLPNDPYVCGECGIGDEDDDRYIVNNIINDRLFRFSSLEALDLRLAVVNVFTDVPLAASFPKLKELRLGLETLSNRKLLLEVVACRNLEFLELTSDAYSDRGMRLKDPEFFSRFQSLRFLTHIHLEITEEFPPSDISEILFPNYQRSCETDLASFFRNSDIQLKQVCLETDLCTTGVIGDVIEGNPQLEVLILLINLHATTEFDLAAEFASLNQLPKLKLFCAVINAYSNPFEIVPEFFDNLDPELHPDLQVAALDFDGSNPLGFLDLVSKVRRRFEDNDKPVQIFGSCDSGGIGLDGFERQEIRLWELLRYVQENLPHAACCLERIFVGSPAYEWQYPWKCQ